MVTKLEEFYNGMPESVREHFFDSRLFPTMDFFKDNLRRVAKFREHRKSLGKRFGADSEEYRLGLEYLKKIYGIEEKGRWNI